MKDITKAMKADPEKRYKKAGLTDLHFHDLGLVQRGG